MASRKALLLLFLAAAPIKAQSDSTAFYKGMEMETAGKNREAAQFFRAALRTSTGLSAMLGLERVYSEMGCLDSLIAPLDSSIAQAPREATYRTIQLRTLQTLGRESELRRAFEKWVQDVPHDPVPYREYARILLERNQAASADTVLGRARAALGGTGGLELQVAQLQAAQGHWVDAATAWRPALAAAPYLSQAAAYSLAPTPQPLRPQVRAILLAPPVDVAARRALAGLASGWGAPSDAWDALRELPPDSASAEAWIDFARETEAEERWVLARAAYESALRWKPNTDVAIHAATAALNAGDPSGALRLVPLSTVVKDSAVAARTMLPLQARALAMLARPSEAEHLVSAYDRWLTPGIKNQLTRTIALGWVRSGDMVRARASLSAAGAEGDSSDAAGWLALYDGDLKSARVLLRGGSETTPELALALGLVARLKADSAPAIGKAFLFLAKNDSVNAAAQFEAAATPQSDASSMMIETAAEIRDGLGDDARAITLWKRVLDAYATSPEAPQAELEWARALRRKGDAPGAAQHLEHLVLTYPESSLVPQARRELDVVRSAVP